MTQARPIDMVNRPPHYTSHPSGVECIEIAEHFSFCLGNVIKYIWRAGLKGDPLEDLRKAQRCLAREIARLERMQGIEAAPSPPAETDGPDDDPEATLAGLKSFIASCQKLTIKHLETPVPPLRRDSQGETGGREAAEPAAPPEVQADTPDFVTGPYTEAEVQQVADLLDQGRSKPEIAAALNRDVRGIHVPIARAQKYVVVRAPKEAAPPRAKPSDADVRDLSRNVHPQPGEVDAARPGDRHDGKHGIRRTLAHHLDRLAPASGWTPAADLTLVTTVMRGDGIAAAAGALETGTDNCRARWAQLTAPIRSDKGLTIDGQAALLEELRERAE